MKVLMVSSSYPQNAEDWRVRFVSDLVYAVARKDGVDLTLWAPPGEKPSVVKDAQAHRERDWLFNLMDRGGIAHILRTGGFRGLLVAVKLLVLLRKAYMRHSEADILHVNWLQNALPLWGIPKPAVISVLGSDYALLEKPFMIQLLRKVIRQRRCILAPNADWMVKGLTDRFGDIAEVIPVPFGVKEMWFEVNRRQNITQTPRKWIAVLRLTKKKIGSLFSWGETIFNRNDELHLLGPMQEKMTVPGWVHYHGPTHPLELCNEWFPKASGLVTLSDHDEGRPQVILEAMAARLPIIASDIPAHRNMIEHQKTGWVANSKESLREALQWLNVKDVNMCVGKAAAEWVKEHIGTWDDCAQRYVSLYERLMGSIK